MIKDQIQRLLEKPVNRREFLGYVGVIFLAFLGASAIVRTISELAGHQDSKKSLQSVLTKQEISGYGRSRYGV